MTDLVFITGNQAKADYLAKWLGHTVPHQKIDLDELQSLDTTEVASHKAREAYKIVGKPVLVEDVSFSLAAFGGTLPGTMIKWFLEGVGVTGILKMLQGFDDRRATAVVTYALFDGNNMYIFEGLTDGTVPLEPRKNGESTWRTSKSWNSIFIPEGANKTYAEMTDEELKPFSHRAKAIQKLQAFLDAQ
jgi:inosine triphosphate pyrophosphatase